MTLLCVAIFVREIAQAKRDIALAAEAGADIVEVRIDALSAAYQVREIVDQSILPLVLTCRATWEGGESELPDNERLALLDEAARGQVRYVDIESITASKCPTSLPTSRQLIISSHDFKSRPAKLSNTIIEMNDGPGSVNKIVWMARSIRDNLEAFDILQSRQKPTIALCMGEAGLISRVLARKFGGFLTFAGLSKESVTAPGQVSIHDMKRLYRWDKINPSTRVYGVVASPVAHSMSPAIHNACFDETGENGVYLPMLVQPGYESFKAFIEEFVNYKPLHLRGLSITLPHKENALKYLQEKGATIDPLAVDIGAINTIIVDRDAEQNPILRGLNTDYQAIIDSICAAKGIAPEQLKDYRVAVIGAGGTGRTAVAALARLGATVVVYNRTKDRADALAAEFNGRSGKVVAAAMEKLCDSCCQIYINTTSLGMQPNVDQSPFGDNPPALSADTLVFDAVYNPPLTKFLRQAEAAGAKTVGGIEMFVRQASSQFLAWTGKSPPPETMRRVIEQRLIT